MTIQSLRAIILGMSKDLGGMLKNVILCVKYVIAGDTGRRTLKPSAGRILRRNGTFSRSMSSPGIFEQVGSKRRINTSYINETIRGKTIHQFYLQESNEPGNIASKQISLHLRKIVVSL